MFFRRLERLIISYRKLSLYVKRKFNRLRSQTQFLAVRFESSNLLYTSSDAQTVGKQLTLPAVSVAALRTSQSASDTNKKSAINTTQSIINLKSLIRRPMTLLFRHPKIFIQLCPKVLILRCIPTRSQKIKAINMSIKS